MSKSQQDTFTDDVEESWYVPELLSRWSEGVAVMTDAFQQPPMRRRPRPLG